MRAVALAILFLLLLPTLSFAGWYDTDYDKCQELTIGGGGFPAGYAFPVETQFNDSKSDLTDLLFIEGTCTSPTGSPLDMWDELVDDGGTSRVWVQADTENVTTIAMYYDNSGATNTFSIGATFPGDADDFDDGSINDTLWDKGASVSESGGVITVPEGNILRTDDQYAYETYDFLWYGWYDSTMTIRDLDGSNNDLYYERYHAKDDCGASSLEIWGTDGSTEDTHTLDPNQHTDTDWYLHTFYRIDTRIVHSANATQRLDATGGDNGDVSGLSRKIEFSATSAACSGEDVTLDWFAFNYPLHDPDDPVTVTFGEVQDFKVVYNSTNETENTTFQVSFTPEATMTEWNATMYYNNTLIYDESDTGSWDTYQWNITAIAPLVDANETKIPFNVSIEYLAGSNYEHNTSGNHTVLLHFYPDAYNFSGDAYTVEAANEITVSAPSALTGSVTYDDYDYVLDHCQKWYANGSDANYTCATATYLSLTNYTDFSILPTHLKEDGAIFQDYYLNRSWNLSYSETSESTSSKTISDSLYNASRDYFIWLVNFSNGGIDGAANLSTTFYTIFEHETSLSSLNADSATATYYTYFADGTNKNFSVDYSGTVSNSTVKGYPDFYTTANISSEEIYSKENYTTRSKFMQYATTDLGEQHNNTIYMLPSSSSTYGIVYVHDAGDPESGAYVQIQKYYAGSGEYLNIEQKITNSEGKAPVYLQMDAYYKFVVYDSDAGLLYTSSQPEQFICDTTCEIEINLDSSANANFIKPYVIADCYGNTSGNYIYFTYSDVTGLTSSVNFLAYRGASVVCNNTISTSSGSYVCSLSAPENLSEYLYTCEVKGAASPSITYFTDLIDFRDITIITDWFLVGIVLVLAVGAGLYHPALSVGVLGVGLVAFAMLGFIDITEGAAIMFLGVSATLAYLMLKEDGG